MKFEIEIKETPDEGFVQIQGTLLEPTRPDQAIVAQQLVPRALWNSAVNREALASNKAQILVVDLVHTGLFIEREGWAEYDRKTKS